VRDLFERDRAFRSAMILPPKKNGIGPQDRARICRFFLDRLQQTVEREDHAIADAVVQHFPPLLKTLREVQTSLKRLPGSPDEPETLRKLGEVLESGIRGARQTHPTVDLVKRNLDLLNEGVHLLQSYAAELTPQAIDAVRGASNLLKYEAEQLDTQEVNGDLEEAVARIRQLLAQDRPWREIPSISGDLDVVRLKYRAERQRLLRWQEEQVEAARARIRARNGYTTLTSDQAHRVFSPLTRAATDTTDEAIAPSLAELGDPFLMRLHRAEEEANDILDGILTDDTVPIIRVELGARLRNRELSSTADIDALVNEIRNTLMEQINAGARIRLQ
jgi:hypothetical protein